MDITWMQLLFHINCIECIWIFCACGCVCLCLISSGLHRGPWLLPWCTCVWLLACVRYINFMSLFLLQVSVQESVETQGSLPTVPVWEGKNLKPRACCVSAARRDTVWLARPRGPAFTTAPGAARSLSVKVGERGGDFTWLIWLKQQTNHLYFS